MTNDLLPDPCPHCGYAKITIERDDIPWGIMRTLTEWWKLRCDGCGTNQTYPSRDGLIERWNRRVSTPNKSAEVNLPTHDMRMAGMVYLKECQHKYNGQPMDVEDYTVGLFKAMSAAAPKSGHLATGKGGDASTRANEMRDKSKVINYCEGAEEARVKHTPQPFPQSDMVAVPREPDALMLECGFMALQDPTKGHDEIRSIYRAMLQPYTKETK